MGIKTRLLEKQLMDSVNDGNFVESMEILSKDKKLAEKYLSVFTNGDFFPEFATRYVESMGKIIKSNDKSSDHLFELFKETRSDLQSYLNENIKELTPDERKYIGEQILELIRMAVKLDKDNKTFLLQIAGTVGGALAFIGLAVGTSLSNSRNDNLADDEEIDDDYRN